MRKTITTAAQGGTQPVAWDAAAQRVGWDAAAQRRVPPSRVRRDVDGGTRAGGRSRKPVSPRRCVPPYASAPMPFALSAAAEGRGVAGVPRRREARLFDSGLRPALRANGRDMRKTITTAAQGGTQPVGWDAAAQRVGWDAAAQRRVPPSRVRRDV